MLSNPRLLVYRAQVERSAGLADVAFAPFLPQVDLLNRVLATNPALSPGAPGPVGGILPDRFPASYTAGQIELQIQWLVHDFGRTASRHGQALSRTKIASLQLDRARETVGYDAAVAYLHGLQSKALRFIHEEARRQAQAVLGDTRAQQQAGVALREAVLRAEVQLAQTQDALLRAHEAELAAQAQLNHVLGREASLPIELSERQQIPPLGLSLPECLGIALRQRQEIGIVRELLGIASLGREAAASEFCPKIYLLSGLGYVQGDNVMDGWSLGAGLHLNQGLYQGGKRRAELQVADAEMHEALAQSRVLLDTISLEVTLAYRHATTARQRIDLARPTLVQASENLRLQRERYRNGDATPTDLVDAQTTFTRASERLTTAIYEYQLALARLDYVVGNAPGSLLEAHPSKEAKDPPASLPPPRPLSSLQVQQPPASPQS